MKSIKEIAKMVKVLHKMYLNEVGETNEFNELEEEARYLLAYTLKKEYLSVYEETDNYENFKIYNFNMNLVNIIPAESGNMECQLLNLAYEGLIAVPSYLGKYKITCEETGEVWYKNTTIDIVDILNGYVGKDQYNFNIKNLSIGVTTSIAVTNCINQFFAYGDGIYNLKLVLAKGPMFYDLNPKEPKTKDEK